jgi:MraZ protein
VDSAGRIGLSESLRKQANLDREVTVVGNYDHLEVWDRAAADEDDDDEALLDLFFS